VLSVAAVTAIKDADVAVVVVVVPALLVLVLVAHPLVGVLVQAHAHAAAGSGVKGVRGNGRGKEGMGVEKEEGGQQGSRQHSAARAVLGAVCAMVGGTEGVGGGARGRRNGGGRRVLLGRGWCRGRLDHAHAAVSAGVWQEVVMRVMQVCQICYVCVYVGVRVCACVCCRLLV
jgi:hypothetical protein